MSKVLVTGASGFVGRHCLPLLVERGFEVHGLRRQRRKEPVVPGVTWHHDDLLILGVPTELMWRVRPEHLLHLAWYADPGKYWQAPENVDWIRASLELFHAFFANQGKRVVAAGTCAEYQRDIGECLEDRSPLLPDTRYGTCKHALERILRSFSQQTGLSSAWGRVFSVYGPFEHPSRVVAYTVRSLLEGQPALCSNGDQLLDFLYVQDVASAFVALLVGEFQGAVNIGSGRPVALSEVLGEIGRQVERQDLIHLGAIDGGGGIRRLWANNQRLSAEVHWAPSYDLARGIAETIEWWRNPSGQHASDEG